MITWSLTSAIRFVDLPSWIFRVHAASTTYLYIVIVVHYLSAELANYMNRYAVAVLNPTSYPLMQAELMKTSYPLIKAEIMMVVMVMPFGIICRS